MSDPSTLTTESDPDYNRIQTRRRRENRADQTFDVTVNERTEIHCHECDESYELTILGCAEDVSFGPCSTWGCDSYHKYVVENNPDEQPEEDVQVDLSKFAEKDDE